MKTHPKSDPKMEPKSSKNHSQIDAKKETKKEVPNLGWAKQTLARSNARDPQTQSFQKTSFGMRCEENKQRKLTKG